MFVRGIRFGRVPRYAHGIDTAVRFRNNDPVVVDGVIYVGFGRHAVPHDIGGAAAMSAADGHVIWMGYAPVHPENPSSPDALDVMKNFRLADGSLAWIVNEVPFHGTFDPEVIYGAPLLDGDRLYAGGAHGIYAFQRP